MSYKTCVSIAEKTPKKLNLSLKKVLKNSDYVEIRFDFLKSSQIPDALELVKRHLRKCICTLRPKNEGGVFSGSEKERVSILKLISEYNPYLIDIEYNTLKKNKNLLNYIKKTKTDVLVSWHDFKKTPSESQLNKMFTLMKKLSKNIKIVTTAKSANDSSLVLSLYNKTKSVNLVAFSMGDSGRISRILCLLLGSPFTYVSLGKAIAPGQFGLNEMKAILTMYK